MIMLGMEEEVQVVDVGGELVLYDFIEGLVDCVSSEGVMDWEIYCCVIELKMCICYNVFDLVVVLGMLCVQVWCKVVV